MSDGMLFELEVEASFGAVQKTLRSSPLRKFMLFWLGRGTEFSLILLGYVLMRNLSILRPPSELLKNALSASLAVGRHKRNI